MVSTSREEFERRRMLVAADRILEHPEQFDMGTWGYRGSACGTAACIAGTALLVAEQEGLGDALWSYERTGSLEGEKLDGFRPKGGTAWFTVDEYGTEYLGMQPWSELFQDLSLGVEDAAKRLLDEPYFDEDEEQS